PAGCSFSSLNALSLIKTKLPRREITNGSSGTGDGEGDGAAAALGFEGELAAAAFGSGEGATGGNTVGRKVSSRGVNLAASSLLGNSMATKISGTSERARQKLHISRDEPSISEFFFRKPTIDLNCGGGSASLRIGSTISPAPPLLSNWPT